MSQPQAQTGTTTPKTLVPTPAPATRSAPVPLDPAMLRQVSGGTQSPHGSW